MKKTLGVFLVIATLIVLVIVGTWKILNIENITDDLFLVGGNSIYQINIYKFKLVELYKNKEYKVVRNKILKVSNIPAIFLKDTLPGEKNIITAWVSKTDNTKVTLAEINSRLKMTKTYQINLNPGKDLELLDPVYDLRLARGGGGEFGLGCEYGNYDSCVWIIPKVEPLKGPGDYEINGIKVSYRDTIAYPVVERFFNKVEYKHMYETIWPDQPQFEPSE